MCHPPDIIDYGLAVLLREAGMRRKNRVAVPAIETDLSRIQQLSRERDDENWEFRSWLKQHAPDDIDGRVADRLTVKMVLGAASSRFSRVRVLTFLSPTFWTRQDSRVPRLVAT